MTIFASNKVWTLWRCNRTGKIILEHFFPSKTHLGFSQNLIQIPLGWSRASWWPQPHLTLLCCLQLFQAQLILSRWLKESDHNPQSVPGRIRAGFDGTGVVSGCGWHGRGWQSLGLTVTGAVVSPGVGTPNTGVSRGLEVPGSHLHCQGLAVFKYL